MSALAEPAEDGAPKRGRASRTLCLALGLLLVGLAFIGIFVPLMPTTDFLILALPCFARSSPRLETWLLNHPRFGAGLRAWRQEGAIPRHAKFAAWAGMGLGYALFLLTAHPGPMLGVIIAGVLGASALWIASRPEPARDRPGER